MAIDRRAELQRVRTFPALIAYLRNELGWPIESDDFEELTFDYTPDELGIDSASAAKIQEIKRLRPLAPSQPWGIFFVKFEPKQLPVVALRRILSRVVVKKRASSNSDDWAAWAADDLLFVSNYGRSDARQISFAHFSQEESRLALPVLKVLGWDNQDTQLHLDHIVDTLYAHLSWPDDEADTDAWRTNWRGAFTLRHREVVATSKLLAVRLAELARSIRDRIAAALAIETEDGVLTTLMRTFREALVHDLDADGFADMYAQTIAYGLLSARIADPGASTVDDFAAHMRTNPFLRELMESFLSAGGRQKGAVNRAGIDFDELGINEVIDLLDNANMDAVLRDFGDRNPQEDPVIHFYELFLKEYDAKKRMERGVFYTPRPVVAYIVRSVDELLCSTFGLDDGLADISTWGEMAKRRPEFQLPDGVDPGEAFVQVLDPATGTGTFLVEAIDLIHRRMVDKWNKQGNTAQEVEDLWNAYVPAHLLPRLHGYELLMAPYAIAHLKIGLKLYETGYRFASDERARVYLTNALEPAHDFRGQFDYAIPALAHEARAVNEIKMHQPFTVVVGNPPYAKSSSNRSDDAEALVADYKRLVFGERNVQPLSDDYVKFLAFAFHASVPSGSIVGMITNRSYLDGLIHRGMRQTLLAACSDIYVTDLHGDSNVGETPPKGRANQNVFDIMQGVAVSLFARGPGSSTDEIWHQDVWGTREEKYAELARAEVPTTMDRLSAPGASFFFSPKNLDTQAEQVGWVAVDELFGVGGMGVKSRRDQFLIAQSRDALRSRFDELAEAQDVESLRPTLGVTDNPQWSLAGMQELVRREGVDDRIVPIAYRPFDTRFIWYHKAAIERGDARWPVMKHVLPDGLSLLTSRQSANAAFSSVFVARGLSEMKTAESTRGSTAFPVRLAGSADDELLMESQGASNVLMELLGAGLAARTPEDVLHYVYAVLHSPTYRSRYAGSLSIAFPRIPTGCPLELADDLCRLGAELVTIHLMDTPPADRGIARYIGPSSARVGKVGWSDETVWLDAAATRKGQPATPGTIGFEGVPREIWDFSIGGYQVCEKWLKDRKGGTLSPNDIHHYLAIVDALVATTRIMREIDELIAQHGGWPAAFACSGPIDTPE